MSLRFMDHLVWLCIHRCQGQQKSWLLDECRGNICHIKRSMQRRSGRRLLQNHVRGEGRRKFELRRHFVYCINNFTRAIHGHRHSNLMIQSPDNTQTRTRQTTRNAVGWPIVSGRYVMYDIHCESLLSCAPPKIRHLSAALTAAPLLPALLCKFIGRVGYAQARLTLMHQSVVTKLRSLRCAPFRQARTCRRCHGTPPPVACSPH